MATSADPASDGQLGQGVVAGGVERVAVVPQLDRHVSRPKRVDQPVELAAGGGRAAGGQRGGDRPLAAPGEDQPVAAVPVAPGRRG